MIRKSGIFLYFFAALLIAAGTAGAQQVDREELEKNQAPIAFINYEGPYVRIETTGQIRGIGYGLGSIVRSGNPRPGAPNRYFVIHSVTAGEEGRLDADIFGLGVDTGVDHIKNLRLIIRGYLEAAYAYSERDAALLAEYITIYNAVYRGDWDYFGGRYKSPVIAFLSREKAGLSIRYDEWPGQTLMLIPLGPGGLSSVDTSSIGDSRVVDELRREEDRGIEQRQDMVDLKEREAEEAEQRASAQREAIQEEERRIAGEREQLGRERDEIAREQAQNQADREAGRIGEGEAARRDTELAARERELDQREAGIERREEDLAGDREEAQRTEEFAQRKTEEAQQEREEIARDQQEIIRQEEERAPAAESGVLGVTLLYPDSGLGRLIRLNPLSGTELRRSSLSTVNARTLTITGGRIIAVAGENRGNGAIRLIEISSDTLEMVKQGDDDIHPASLLWANGTDLYALTVSRGSVYLGRFIADLVRQAQSAVQVHPYATVVITDGLLVTQRADGSAVFLKPGDLTEAFSGN
jgi:hypothetical protein